MTPNFDVHAGYAGMVLLGLALTLAFPVTGHFQQASDKQRYYILQAITAIGALIGAKIAVVLGDALWPLQPFDNWLELLTSGRSIVGALLFGFIAAETAKPLLNYDIPPNDRFAVILPFSIGIGRIGCYIVGCCRGIPYDGPLAITYSDHIPRHPAQIYELVFHFLIGLLLLQLLRKKILFGRLFALFLILYGVFRFGSEFLRETAKPYYGLSAYQLMCVALIAAGLITLIVRSRRQPDSWQRWVSKGAQV